MSALIDRSERPPTFERMSGEMRRADILEAALCIFAEKGYDRASLQEIAEQVGILKGSIYYYYKSKEDLLFDILAMIYAEHMGNLRMLDQGEGDPVARLKYLLSGHAAFLCRNSVRTTVLLRDMHSLPVDRGKLIWGSGQDYRRVFRDLICEAQSAGQVPWEVNAKLAALWIVGSLNWLHRWYRPDRSRNPQEVGEEFADQLTRGVTEAQFWSADASGLDVRPA